ncbi:MAG: preprotein translocase subunit SecE [Clostridia bacterium]|nr:preprotein translocase subunit SecE [Clostridia bacterium]
MSEAVSKNGSEAAPQKKSWFKGLKSEFNKIMWTDKKTITKQTIAVVSISIVLGLIITLIDTILQFGIDFIVKL